ncbi:DUF2254 domain-containing protein [Nitrosomonas supralitoralis]|uniref:DUF2254 domain-containing protein n=1 Tax=Nitrosomonas supralitoralis TaxID=2116706 RepID=A0A2P7NWR2_9PROT|nr:DUF2254 domain-containing protein [Nitrosomonas supralitoralis]PSJ17903.1 DUF2254 domain-containing protein [Nitrosomonas supralitoralis]
MPSIISPNQLRFLINRLHERLWVKPLLACLLSISAALAAKLADGTELGSILPAIKPEPVETMLSIMAASMLVIATFAVTSMVSAYASASNSATPRAFSLVISDDGSQNALSTFIGAFIYSIVALTAMKNGYFGAAGRFTLFVLTSIAFGVVILTLVRWVDSIARLGRVGTTITKVEQATVRALLQRKQTPTLHGIPIVSQAHGWAIFAPSVGYVQHIDFAALQAWAEKTDGGVEIAALPGTFAAPGRALAYIRTRSGEIPASDCEQVVQSFQIGNDRLFDEDPRFGLVVLSEIACRALSPAVNDPGTAINIIGTLVRLFVLWNESPKSESEDKTAPKYSRVEVPQILVRDMFDDAFTGIARDGAGMVEVMVRLQKALQSLALIGDAPMKEAAKHHGRLALERARLAMNLAQDLAVVRNAATFAKTDASSKNSRDLSIDVPHDY